MIWVVAIAEAHMNTIRAGITSACFVLASTTCTPVTRLVAGSYSRLLTTASGRNVSLPVARAAGRVTAWVAKYAPNEHPRPHWLRYWHLGRPSSGLSSVRLDMRALISLRPGDVASSRSFTHFSATFICIGGWKALSGSWGRFSREPDTPI